MWKPWSLSPNSDTASIAYQNLWHEKNVKATCLKKGCYTIHNYWITQRLNKLVCQVSSGLRKYDSSTKERS
ncbi:nucleotide-diphospho-sugar transferase family protein, putative [Medicago truncatula]|uniref:Nucleotide-diphospho-sugar transferase family protein, putative n=1 Tax=Medicago truncatula TaxID=3880 RepID=G7KFL4_MEDTR|nr:nucleotide-diphospho-sugar transferase family protein, putative [Medicago truncatula]